MNIKQFAEKVQKALRKELGEGYDILLQIVEKNNGVQLQGLTILCGERNVSPTIYLEPFWDAYERGQPLADIVRKIVRIYRRDVPNRNVDMSFFRDFEKVKKSICYRLIHAQMNSHLLQRIPHVTYLDLAICFYYIYEDALLGQGTILIYNNHVDAWGTSVEELIELAEVNTPRLLPVCSTPIEELLCGSSVCGEAMPDSADRLMMEVVSNDRRSFGAACILYPGVLEKLAGYLDGSFYLLPSSIHELVVLRENEGIQVEQLKEMIVEVNETLVAKEEKLSDSLYYFDAKKREIKIV